MKGTLPREPLHLTTGQHKLRLTNLEGPLKVD